MRKRVERDNGTHCVSGVNPSTGLVDAPNRNYFSQNTPFFILQLCLAPFFNFFPLSNLKYNLPQISRKIGFFRENIGFFRFFGEKSAIFPDFLPIFFPSDFFLSKSFPCHPKTDFSPINQSKNPIFCSLVLTTIPILYIMQFAFLPVGGVDM